MRRVEHDWLRKMLWGCTFDDFLISPGWGVAVSRKDISLVSRFSQNIPLNIPLVSANMDTITGARMAITVAKKGGIGIIHRYLSNDDQCKKVEEVKREENFIIEKPYSIFPDATVGEAKNIMLKNKVGGLVVVDELGKLVGILTERDVRYCSGTELIQDRMTKVPNLITAKSSEISLAEVKKLMDDHRLEKLPIVDDDFCLKGLITSRDVENLEKFPLANKDKKGQLLVGAAIGATGDYLERSADLIKAGADVIVLDIANAQSNIAEKAVAEFRKRFPDMELVVGNIVLPGAVKVFNRHGVNGFKVGLGPGSACTTRKNTGIGIPQAQAVYSCSMNSEFPICADGGIKRDGSIAEALILGGSSVMIGGMFAGTDETPGLVFPDSDGKKVKAFRGMASREAMYEKLHAEEADNPYETSSRISPEGIERKVEYRGSVVPIINDMMGHLASTISYMGAMSLQEAKEMFMAHPTEYLIKLSESAKRESWDR
ncbi:MAG: IMP dehydrogenase [Candidatus Yanofskybacteria bacterium]|nr:IMP dehydrogenase [Candidatus Yanofskybacteria bacterium]